MSPSGKFLASSETQEAWMSSTSLDSWESFGNGRSCCVDSLFEVPFVGKWIMIEFLISVNIAYRSAELI